jgi:gluconokinase
VGIVNPQVIVIMGVAGSGKTTVGRLLARSLGCPFADADDFHPPANVAKMGAGRPLTDEDRAPWLAAIRTWIEVRLDRRENGVVTCSALKSAYRRVLLAGDDRIRLVHLQGTRELLQARIGARQDHFMKPSMLDSQLAALEPPADALTLDIAPPPAALVTAIRRELHL